MLYEIKVKVSIGWLRVHGLNVQIHKRNVNGYKVGNNDQIKKLFSVVCYNRVRENARVKIFWRFQKKQIHEMLMFLPKSNQFGCLLQK